MDQIQWSYGPILINFLHLVKLGKETIFLTFSKGHFKASDDRKLKWIFGNSNV